METFQLHQFSLSFPNFLLTCLCNRLDQYTTPEIFRTPLHELCLSIKLLRLGPIGQFLAKAVEPPPIDAVIEAEALLRGQEELNSMNFVKTLRFYDNYGMPLSSMHSLTGLRHVCVTMIPLKYSYQTSSVQWVSSVVSTFSGNCCLPSPCLVCGHCLYKVAQPLSTVYSLFTEVVTWLFHSAYGKRVLVNYCWSIVKFQFCYVQLFT